MATIHDCDRAGKVKSVNCLKSISPPKRGSLLTGREFFRRMATDVDSRLPSGRLLVGMT
jgi:hypothetical protein